ncbi:MAG TPA: hypothetical protein VM818_11970 [Vicinamibacterales bacterium]|jgi:hypothetical protein|nr:hypothetical protein [Vicinamibacterales bacterium]
MYTLVLFLHSWLRWLALGAGLAAVLAALGKGGEDVRRLERRGLVFMIALDTQLLLGLLLYGLLSPFTSQAMQDFGGAMRDPLLRFWAVEHFTMMLMAAILVHVGRVLARNTADAGKKRKRMLVCFGLALLLILVGIPWPWMAVGRPLFRM